MHTDGRPRIVKVKEKIQETPDITTLRLDTRVEGKPGQYLMVWIPGVDEIPMSLSGIGDDTMISIRVVGEATAALAAKKVGEPIGVRGPFGNGYTVKGRHPLLVGGGSGLASLLPLAEAMKKAGVTPTVLMGARSSNQLLFKDRYRRLLGDRVTVSTDDGTEGLKGYASIHAADIMNGGSGVDQVYMCGPELMMIRVFDAAEARGLPVQASLERICKCAVGLCGSCTLGPYRVCADGPVFDTGMLRVIKPEWGKLRLDATGRAVKVEH